MFKLPFGNKANKAPNKFLTIDIDSDKVKCLAFYVPNPQEENEISSISDLPVAKIIGVGVQRFDQGTVRNGVIINHNNLAIAAKKAIDEATRNADDISDVIFGVSGQLAQGLVTTAKINRDNATEITEKELSNLQNKVIQAAFTQAQNEVLQISGDADVELELITSSNVYLKVDNALTNNPVGIKGSTLEIAFFTAFCPVYQVVAFQRLAKELGLNILAIGSEMYCLLKAMQKSQEKVSDCILINIDTDYTDVAVVFGGGIVATRSIDIGSAHLTKAIGEKTGLSYIESEKMKRTYSYGRLTPTETELIRAGLQEPLKIWLTGLKLLFGEFTGVKTFAHQIYLLGEAAEMPDIYEALGKEAWTKTIPFKAPPEYKKISLKELRTITDSTGTLGSLEYVLNAALSTIYLEMKGLLND